MFRENFEDKALKPRNRTLTAVIVILLVFGLGIIGVGVAGWYFYAVTGHYTAEEVIREAPVTVAAPEQRPGRTAVEEFIEQFPSIFQLGWRDLETGVFYDLVNWDLIEAEEIPLVSLGGIRNEWGGFAFDGESVFDKHGNLIIEALFLSNMPDINSPTNIPAVATEYSLYDLFDDGFYVIVVSSIIWASSDFGWAGGRVLYAYIDGEYREVFIPRTYPSFFRDNSGNIVILYGDHYHSIYGYYYLTVVNGSFTVENIVDENMFNHITQTQLPYSWWEYHYNLDWQENPRIPGMPDETLTRIPSLFRLQMNIDSYVRPRLMEARVSVDYALPH